MDGMDTMGGEKLGTLSAEQTWELSRLWVDITDLCIGSDKVLTPWPWDLKLTLPDGRHPLGLAGWRGVAWPLPIRLGARGGLERGGCGRGGLGRQGALVRPEQRSERAIFSIVDGK